MLKGIWALIPVVLTSSVPVEPKWPNGSMQLGWELGTATNSSRVPSPHPCDLYLSPSMCLKQLVPWNSWVSFYVSSLIQREKITLLILCPMTISSFRGGQERPLLPPSPLSSAWCKILAFPGWNCRLPGGPTRSFHLEKSKQASPDSWVFILMFFSSFSHHAQGHWHIWLKSTCQQKTCFCLSDSSPKARVPITCHSDRWVMVGSHPALSLSSSHLLCDQARDQEDFTVQQHQDTHGQRLVFKASEALCVLCLPDASPMIMEPGKPKYKVHPDNIYNIFTCFQTWP